MAQPLKVLPLTDEQKEHIRLLLQGGAQRITAVKYAGASLRALRAAMSAEAEFAASIERAEAASQFLHLQNIQKAAGDTKQWRASAWWLERSWPRLYGPRKGETVTGLEIETLLAPMALDVCAVIRDCEAIERLCESFGRLARAGHSECEPSPPPLAMSMARAFLEALESVQQELDAAERVLLRPKSTLTWGQHYLPEHFSRPPSDMHRWLGEQLDAMFAQRGLKVNVIGPRGSAKSTLGALCHVLRAALEGRERYIWIVSDTIHQARAHLENVKAELAGNPLLLADYPKAAGRGTRWRAATVHLPNGVVIEAFGTGQRIRGHRYRQHRPTLIVCDDLQNDGHIVSAALRATSLRWFQGTLLKAGTRDTNIVNLATALHREAIALVLHRTPGWTSALFRAIEEWPQEMELWRQWEEIYCQVSDPEAADKARQFFERHRVAMQIGAQVLWPAVEDLYTLMQMRVESGHTAFEREKQSSPVDPELCEWPEEYFDDAIWFERWPASLAELPIRAIALDPSKGSDARRGDYSAYVLAGIDTSGVIYVEADLARRPTPQMVADGVEHCRRFRPAAFGVEANQFQDLLADQLLAEMRRQKVHFVVPCAIHNSLNKQVRIRRLGPYLSQRRLRFHARSAGTRLLVDQLRDFPAGGHDDGPDALEMAIRLLEDVWHGRGVDDGLGDRLRLET